MVSLWRYLRTPVLLTSATVFVIGCASKNPLIDEAEPSEDTEKVSVATDKTDRTEDNAPLAAAVSPLGRGVHSLEEVKEIVLGQTVQFVLKGQSFLCVINKEG